MKNVEMKKLTKAAMAMALAGTVAFSPALASADTLKEGQKVQAETSVTTDVQVKNDAEKPALIPGDFFYFVKIALEKIKLAITFDKEKEADLLAGYAAERLAEAEELFNAGKEDLAVKTLQDGIAFLNEYDAKQEETTDEQKSEEPIEEEQKSDEQKAEDKTEGTEQQPVEEEATEQDEDKTESSDELVRNNIIALKAALEKVKNPTARAALQKNIDKTLAKMAEKAEKSVQEQEKSEIDKKDEAPENTDEVAKTNETEKSTQTDKAVSAEAEVTVKEETKGKNAAIKAVPATPAVPASAAKQEAKQKAKEVRKQAQQEVKEVRSQAKQQAKEVKQAEKAAKVEAKAQVKVEKKANGNGAENGKNGN
ncbi:DUF5667 domain-containing protein [Neobacillus sp. YIM B06451]|uniref:DUF5667 domain-containing protein n=1 Tax=Neobacillus sp. YIM B06451 TaxID=3070994 RepID=UPI00292FCA15|nr:DUF5667 domain-containing protein [Neobacillus sp. YIM B06451]